MRPLLPLILFFCTFAAHGDVVLTYSYDAAGNRICREIVLSRSIETPQEPITEKIAEKQIKIYPNPTHGLLKVEIDGWEQSDNCTMVVYNQGGVQVETVKVSSPITEMDLSRSSNGLYILLISINENNTSWKIIKK